jgi:glycosyltransferase involved in cell wall biosynthesis
MNEFYPHRAKIQPVPDGQARPLWSVMIPTYNCANYLRGTLTSVLTQDPGPELMQIEVVDDCSTEDDPKSVVEELGCGRVEFYQQPENVGYIKNFETCLQRAQGHLIHLLHGDDCIRDGFYVKMQQLFEQYPDIGAAFCRHIIMDDNGHWQRISRLEQTNPGVLTNWLERIATELPLQTPSMVVRRKVYESLGGFDRRMLSCGEDWEMWVRIAARYSVAYEPEPLACYRDRSGSLTKTSIRTGQNIRDVRTATIITQSYLPSNKVSYLTKRAGEGWASWAFHYATQFLIHGDLDTAIVQIQEGLHCSHSPKTLKQALPLLLKVAKRKLVQAVRRDAYLKP